MEPKNLIKYYRYMNNMLTNEQILTILNTWTVEEGYIRYRDMSIILRKNKVYSIEFSLVLDENKEYIPNVYLSLYKRIDNRNTIIFTYLIPDEIKLKVVGLVTIKVEDYVKKNIEDILAVPEGFDALV